MEISDSTLAILWDKWKTQNALVYDRYNRFWALQIAVIGWVLFALRKGVTPSDISSSEAVSSILILALFPLLGMYIVALMKADLTVRNSHNPEIITALQNRGLLSLSESDMKSERETWMPTNFTHKWNNWHAGPTNNWALNNTVTTLRGTTTAMTVVYCLCFIDLCFASILTYLNFWA